MSDLQTLALAYCPHCSSPENMPDMGGNERCFHCECGYIQCADERLEDVVRIETADSNSIDGAWLRDWRNA